MSFYAVLSKYYDEVFPAGASEMRFVKQVLANKRRLLDIGCGNGNKTVLLAQRDREIYAVDGDAAMIAAARQNYAAPGIDYAVRDMRDLRGGLPGRSFDGVLCLGNTLVHLPDKSTVEALLADVYALMSAAGVFVVQILHYEWIIAGKVAALPLIDTAHVVFHCDYVWEEGVLHFKTTLTGKADGSETYGDIVLLPLLTAELAEMLRLRGFTDLRHYGDYDGGPLKDDSLVSIIVCCK